jgi:hypothetical protein
MEKGRKAFEAYHANLEELFLSCCKVMRHGTVLKDTTSIIFNKSEVIPEVWSDPSPSRNDIQSTINSALERQAKSTNELLCRLIEERDEKTLDATSVNTSFLTCAISFTKTNPYTSGPSVGDTSMSNPSTQPKNHFHSQITTEGSAPTFGMSWQTTVSMFRQGYMHTAPSFAMPNPSSAPYTPGITARHIPTLMATTKPHTLP